MAKLNWPPENTLKYEFEKDLGLVIELKDNKKLVKEGKTDGVDR